MKISILTSTYNRSKLLNRLYKSILINNQNTNNIKIEWLIMDDGSTDNTAEVVKKYQTEQKQETIYSQNKSQDNMNINIKYYFQENQGKMKALNFLVKQATGNYIIECDSDDYFTDDAFELISKNVQLIDNNTYALCFLKYDQNKKNIGKIFKNKQTTMFNLYFKEGENGEKALVFNSNIRKQYEHELMDNEKFVTEARMYHKMDLKYKIQCINKPIMICEYQQNGYSENINKIFKQNPKGYFEYFKEIFEHNLKGVSFSKKLYIFKHYILFAVLTKRKLRQILKYVNNIKNKILISILYLPGKMLTHKKLK